jgi:TBC1 domain family member 14
MEDEWVGTEHDPHPVHENGFSDAHGSDTYASTVDLDRPSPDTHSRSASQSSVRSPGDPSFFHHFSRISLSERPTESQDQEEAHIPYPTVIIDVSKPPPNRVEVLSERHGPPHLQLESPSTDQEDLRSQPYSAPSSTSPSLNQTSSSSALPPSLSAPGQSSTFVHHRQSRSAGPSAFQKVLSKTRPTFLPPKDRQEDRKHMADWEAMMKQSRAAGEYG